MNQGSPFHEHDTNDAMSHQMLNSFLRLNVQVIFLIGYIVKLYACTIPIFATVSTRQEYKIWKTTPTPLTLLGISKVFIYNILWMAGCLLGAIALIPMWISRGLGNSVQLESNVVIEKLMAYACHQVCSGPVEIVNGHNLPPIKLMDGDSPAPIFIANHCSQLDVSAVYFAIRRFKWIAKKSVRYIPGPGNLMFLGGHVFIQRTGKNSKNVSNLYQMSNDAIQTGCPMMFFPQGTRRMSEKLPFKDGAFRIAVENESVLIPMTINVPDNAWNSSYPFNLLWGGKGYDSKTILTVHDPIPTKKGMEIKALKEECQEIIYSALPPLYHGQKKNGHNDSDKKNS